MSDGAKRAAAWFLGGLLIGVLVAGWAPRPGRGDRGDRSRHERLTERFHRKLDLTPEQREKVGAVLKAKKERMNALWGEVHPRFEELRSSTREEIAALLTPEQRAKFETLEKKREARRDKRRRRGAFGCADGAPAAGLPPPPAP